MYPYKFGRSKPFPGRNHRLLPALATPSPSC